MNDPFELDDYYYKRGELYYKAGMKQQAVYDFRKACDINGVMSRFNEPCKRLQAVEKEIDRGEKWVEFSHGGDKSFYYDKTSIKTKPNKRKLIWVRIEEENVNTLIQERESAGKSREGYEDYSHTIFHCELDCINRQNGIASIIDYDTRGKVLASSDFKRSGMSNIIPDSMIEVLYQVVCEGKKKGK